MAIQYEIDDGVLILSMVAGGGFESLRGALHAAAKERGGRPKMPLLIDVRTETTGVRYEDIRSRVQILAQMHEQLAPRWAILTGTGPVRFGIAKMFAVFGKVEGLEVGMFADKAAALEWLREPIARDTLGTI